MTKAGRWDVKEYDVRMECTGGYLITSNTQYKEKCKECDIDTPCCVSGCEVFDWKEDEECRYCKFSGQCFGCMDKLDEYYVEFEGSVTQSDSSLIIKHDGKEYGLDDIYELEDSVDKFILYFKYVNAAYRYYGCEDIQLKVKKTDDKIVISFQDKMYTFPRDFTKAECLAIVFRDVESYRVDKPA